MRIVEQGPKPDRVWSLQVHTRLGRRAFAAFMGNVEGVEITRLPRLFSGLRESVFLEFRFDDVEYVVEPEPFAGSYFEIACKKPGCRLATTRLRDAMQRVLR